MLIFMRKHAKFFYVLFVVIIVSFIFFYVGPTHEKENVAVIEVGGKKIFLVDYWRIHDNLKNYFKNVYKEKFDAEMEKNLNIKDKAIELIVGNEILLIAAERFGIETSDYELNDAIVNDPAFKRDNVFREDVYNKVLQMNRMTVGFFESKRREELTVEKVKRFIAMSSGFSVSDLPKTIADDKKMLETIMPQLVMDSKEKTITSYINSMKKTIPIKINREMLS
ncbi:MAG: SurA N-terminal domain-containing protein [Nitrospirae bacterium]|nr:SurA N-terminal domain-containing protein [Nitrospirota bacterium]